MTFEISKKNYLREGAKNFPSGEGPYLAFKNGGGARFKNYGSQFLSYRKVTNIKICVQSISGRMKLNKMFSYPKNGGHTPPLLSMALAEPCIGCLINVCQRWT